MWPRSRILVLMDSTGRFLHLVSKKQWLSVLATLQDKTIHCAFFS